MMYKWHVRRKDEEKGLDLVLDLVASEKNKHNNDRFTPRELTHIPKLG